MQSSVRQEFVHARRVHLRAKVGRQVRFSTSVCQHICVVELRIFVIEAQLMPAHVASLRSGKQALAIMLHDIFKVLLNCSECCIIHESPCNDQTISQVVVAPCAHFGCWTSLPPGSARAHHVRADSLIWHFAGSLCIVAHPPTTSVMTMPWSSRLWRRRGCRRRCSGL